MGRIYETNSQIFGLEERSESCIVWESGKKWDEEPQHIFVGSKTPKSKVRDEIISMLMQQAGDAFAKGNETEANRLKKCATDVRYLKFDSDVAIAEIEVSKEWLKELFNFLAKNKNILE